MISYEQISNYFPPTGHISPPSRHYKVRMLKKDIPCRILFLHLQQFKTMNLKLFNTRLSTESALADQQAINSFMDSVSVKKTSTQFVPGNPDFWSILVFYEDLNGTHKKETEKQPAITEEDLNETEKSIYAALRLWRKDRATEINLPEFMVCHNATLMTVAKEKPQDLLALSKIKGLGDQKIAKYGDDIVAILNAF